MSYQTSSSYSTTSYSSSSSSSSNGGAPRVTATRSAQQSHTDASGNTTVSSAHQNLGEAPIAETRSFDREGRQLVGEGSGGGVGRIGGAGESTGPRITEVEGESENDRVYRERMEEEYAKREGGA